MRTNGHIYIKGEHKNGSYIFNIRIYIDCIIWTYTGTIQYWFSLSEHRKGQKG